MDNYTANYQAPYRYYAVTPAFLEPVGDPLASPATAAQNTTDFVTFCTDCHNASNVIYSNNLSRNLRTIDWDNEKHGRGSADVDIQVLGPYTSGGGSLGYVLSCLDCHEPHGSPNIFLLRMETNGKALSGTINNGFDFGLFCERCHDDGAGGFSAPWEDRHHENPDRSYFKSGSCGSCHPGGTNQQDCSRCHFHGAETGSDGIETCTSGAAIRKTF